MPGRRDGETMRRSKVEMHVDILEVLDHCGPLKLTHIMSKAHVNCNVLKEYLDFLTKQENPRILALTRVF